MEIILSDKMNTPSIKLSLIGDTAFCFNAADYMTIRTEYRIIGRLVGCSVKWPRNISLNGLPAIYSPYETQLLIDKGIIQLCQKTFSDVPDKATELLYEQRCTEQRKIFQEIYIDKKLDDTKKYMAKILAGKRKKALKSGDDISQITEQTILDEARKRAINDVTNVFIQVPTQEPFEVDFVDVKSAPKLDLFKYKVFCDLWEKGHWITSGETFGGDFLLYPNEPLHFHASHIIHILSQDEAKAMTSRTFITRTRLSVNVNKLCTFVYENMETNKLCYQTVQWLGK